MLDGCYSWPGPCRSKAQANAYCRMKGFDYASDYSTSNRGGFFQTRRLGDDGVCTASCTVMNWVDCDDD